MTQKEREERLSETTKRETGETREREDQLEEMTKGKEERVERKGPTGERLQERRGGEEEEKLGIVERKS